MTYTREMELQFQDADEAVRVADDTRRPLKNARDKAFDELGDMLLHCPQRLGTRGAAEWAIGHANYLTEMLAPFTSEPVASLPATLVEALRRIAVIGNEDGLLSDEYQERLRASAGYARQALETVGFILR